MHTEVVFGELELHISDEDWKYMCENRFFTDNPEYDDIQAEFVSGTGITSQRRELWDKASENFAEYIQELREIRKKRDLDSGYQSEDSVQELIE